MQFHNFRRPKRFERITNGQCWLVSALYCLVLKAHSECAVHYFLLMNKLKRAIL